jgi:hypothetical protein
MVGCAFVQFASVAEARYELIIFLYPLIYINATVCFTNFVMLNLVKIRNSGLVLGSSQFFTTALAASKMKLALKVVKNDSKNSSCFTKLNTCHRRLIMFCKKIAVIVNNSNR